MMPKYKVAKLFIGIAEGNVLFHAGSTIECTEERAREINARIPGAIEVPEPAKRRTKKASADA